MTRCDRWRRPPAVSLWRALRKAVRAPGPDQLGLLDAHLRQAIAKLGGSSDGPLDVGILAVLLDLYDEPDLEFVWEHFVAPFIAQHRDDLRATYARDRSLPNPLLARPEGLLLLERLEHVPAQLAESWPGRQIELARLAQNWAVAI